MKRFVKKVLTSFLCSSMIMTIKLVKGKVLQTGMKKEDILQKSREENAAMDEREFAATNDGMANGMFIGNIVCALWSFIAYRLFNKPEIVMSNGIIFFSMNAFNQLTVYKSLKTKTSLAFGIVSIIAAIAMLVACIVYIS